MWECRFDYLEGAVEEAVEGQELDDVGAETADGSFFHGEEHLVRPRQVSDQAPVEWLAEPCVGDGDLYAAVLQQRCRGQAALNC